MNAVNVLTDVKSWAAVGIILGLVFGFDSPDAASILMLVLIAQMTLSLEGVTFCKKDFREYRAPILGCIAGCFLLNTGMTLLMGLFFIQDTALWYGWVMLASVPCGVSVVSASLFMKGDTKLSILGLTGVYLAALAVTPLITHILIGNAVSPLDILRYIMMFILIPFALTVPLRRLHIPRTPKIVGINALMLLMVFIGLGSRRDYIFSQPDTALWLMAACVLRLFVFCYALVYAMRRAGLDRGRGVVYMTMCIWKNSGMSISMTMALVAPMYPEAVLPCAISLVMEMAWFTLINATIDKVWPRDAEPA